MGTKYIYSSCFNSQAIELWLFIYICLTFLFPGM